MSGSTHLHPQSREELLVERWDTPKEPTVAEARALEHPRQRDLAGGGPKFLAVRSLAIPGPPGAITAVVEPVRGDSRDLTVHPLRIEQSALGPRAGLVGALALRLQAVCAVVPATAKLPQPPPCGGE